MTDSDLNLLGLSDEYGHPESMILTVMPVSPPPVRPSITVDGGVMRSEDDLTDKLEFKCLYTRPRSQREHPLACSHPAQRRALHPRALEPAKLNLPQLQSALAPAHPPPQRRVCFHARAGR
ncbi:hypothetical protein C8F04DRAFT_1272222 [Mycena alexandri]|uniref:DNA-directed RNA polymerase n=1 Tax=Mycena alexandri TaxID=1745969 RepID=A0AAD6SAP3_9AGAR|nr:hypothetical protein C8F04DRAFT_1272222 [Mycena alexandri]